MGRVTVPPTLSAKLVLWFLYNHRTKRSSLEMHMLKGQQYDRFSKLIKGVERKYKQKMLFYVPNGL